MHLGTYFGFLTHLVKVNYFLILKTDGRGTKRNKFSNIDISVILVTQVLVIQVPE
jgi:hypothetical protein